MWTRISSACRARLLSRACWLSVRFSLRYGSVKTPARPHLENSSPGRRPVCPHSSFKGTTGHGDSLGRPPPEFSKRCALALRDDVERNHDVDFGMQVHRHRVRADRLDMCFGQPDDPLVQVWPTGLLDSGNNVTGSQRAEQLAGIKI